MTDNDASNLIPPGKLPAELLGRILARNTIRDERVLISPRIGTDAAAIRFGDQALVVKSDPITFPTANIGHYLVNVNANDIACMGAVPRWLLVTSLLPETSTTAELVEGIFDDVLAACDEIGVSLVGGHTEITIGIDRPILIGSMFGDVPVKKLIDPRSAEAGDAVILCGAVAIEGTSILANQAKHDDLAGISPEVLERAKNLVIKPGISVLPAAQAIRNAGIRPRAMHDPTEGGLATALDEIAASTGHGIVVQADQISILDETRQICDALDLDPLGLIASGALLAVVIEEDVDQTLNAVRQVGIDASKIGNLVEDPSDRIMMTEVGQSSIPQFVVDEIARYFNSLD